MPAAPASGRARVYRDADRGNGRRSGDPLLAKVAIDDATGVNDGGPGLPVIVTALILAAVIRFGCQFGRRITAGRLSIVQNALRLRLFDTPAEPGRHRAE